MKRFNILRSLAAGALGIGLISGLFFLTDVSLDQLADLFAHLNWLAFAGILLCTLAYVALGGMKWQLIAGVPGPRPFFYSHYTAQAMLLGQFLPMPVAIVANRAAVMKLKQNATVKKGLLNAIYDMGFDFLVAAIFVVPSLLQLVYRFDFAVWFVIGIALTIAAAALLMLAPKILPRRLLANPWLAEERKRGLLAPRLIGLMMLLSIARFAAVIARLICGAVAIGIAMPFDVVAYATPIVTMSALLAFTPGNLGIAEWSWAYLLTLWGITVAAGTLYGVSFRVLTIIAQLFAAGVLWAFYRSGKRS